LGTPEKPEPGNLSGSVAISTTATGTLDFTKEPAPAPLGAPVEKPYDPSEDRERLRGKIAIGVLSLLGSMVVGPFALAACHVLPLAEIKELLTITYGPIIGLAGTAMGFYFGTSKSRGE